MPQILAILVVLLLLLNPTELAWPQDTSVRSPEPTLWEHNGSVLYLVANDSWREFHYKDPRLGLLEAGARPGSLLFRGHSIDGMLEQRLSSTHGAGSSHIR
jgi:hypothetical protein